MKFLVPIVAIATVFTFATFAISIATLVRVNRELDEVSVDGTTTTSGSPISTTGSTNAPTTTASPITITTTTTGSTNAPTTTASPITTTTTTTTTASPITTTQPAPNETLATNIRFEDVMRYLTELQQIATAENQTRAFNTPGFNQTLDYIIDTLNENTNYTVTKSFFYVRQFTLVRNPILISSINGTIQNHTFSNDLAVAEFYIAQFSTSADFSDYVELTVIPNLGCTDDDWLAANPSPSGRVALVKRGNCTFVEKAAFASKYNVAALLIYNDGGSPSNISPIPISLGPTNELPALFLSYTLGQELADAAEDPTANVRVLINIVTRDDPPTPVGNICADTPTGDATQTIVIGSHSDSVTAGPGINDNGK
jgi:hypothetical protein